MGFSRQEYWCGLPCPSPEDLPDPRMSLTSSAFAGGFFNTSITWEALCIYIHRCNLITLCRFMKMPTQDCCCCFSPYVMANSFATVWTVLLQAPLSMWFPKQETLEWVAISFSRGSSWPRDQTHLSLCLLHWRAEELMLSNCGTRKDSWKPLEQQGDQTGQS